MTTTDDAADLPDPFAPQLPPLEDESGPLSLFQEINERRARVENAELLQHLRGL